MRSAFILLCLYLAFDPVQCGLISPEDLTPTCKDEAKKIATCESMVPKFSLIDDIPLSSKQKNLALISGIHQVLVCTGQMYCSSSMLYQSYLRNQEWILTQWHGELEECLVDNDVYSQIQEAYRGPGRHKTECDTFFTDYTMTALRVMQKRSDVCSVEARKMFYSVTMALRASCYMEGQLYVSLRMNNEDNGNHF